MPDTGWLPCEGQSEGKNCDAIAVWWCPDHGERYCQGCRDKGEHFALCPYEPMD